MLPRRTWDRRVVHALALGVLLLALGSPARGEDAPPAPPALPALPAVALEARAQVLAVELRRGPAEALEPWLAAGAHPQLRRQAVRALGRIGDRAGAPRRLAALLAAGGPGLVEVLQAAGVNAAPTLAEAVRAHAGAADPAVAAAALEALGWIGGDAAVLALARGLHRSEPAVLAAALAGLARARPEFLLERVLGFLGHPDAGVRREAWFAAWMLSGSRRRAVTSGGSTWAGDAALAALVDARRDDAGLLALDLVRPLGLLAPLPVEGSVGGPGVALLEAWAGRVLMEPLLPGPLGPTSIDPQPEPGAESLRRRLRHEVIARLLGPRRGPEVERALLTLLQGSDPIAREAVLEAAGAAARSPAFAEGLRAHAAREQDARVREALAVALARAGEAAAAEALLARDDRPADPVLRTLTGLRVAAAAKTPEALARVVDLALAPPAPAAALLEALSLLEEQPGPAAARLVEATLAHADPFVAAAAVGLCGKQGRVDLAPRLDALLALAQGHAGRDLRQAVVEAWAAWLEQGKADEALAASLRERLVLAARVDPSFTARAAARAALGRLGAAEVPVEDPLQPNEWGGLPRPRVPVLGLDLTAGAGPLTEAEILALADALVREQPEVVVESDVGTLRLRVDASEAPVHAVSLVLNALAGTYDGTPWHRVVPSFVIQGGDPHGTGNGDAGVGLPDEITTRRFVRGALGMPKGELRDTGGCQLFIMHSDYRPLDGRYTCYGEVTEGMDTVDRIRVGDRIVRARLRTR
ncbi:MAG: peptidylprolyl isomerase [Planctomycetia bacterium]